MNRIVFAAVMAVAALTLTARAQEPQKPAAPASGFPARMNMGADALKQFDKDGDGKLNDEERKTMMEARKTMGENMRKAREKEFDKNGDGKLDDTEKAAMMEARKAQMEKLMKEREKEFDKDGDGKLSDDERKAMMDTIRQRHPAAGAQMGEMMKRFDKDGDGKLNDEERKAAMEERMKHMRQQEGGKPAVAIPAAKPVEKPAEAAK